MAVRLVRAITVRGKAHYYICELALWPNEIARIGLAPLQFR
jgi:hypothetical protein